MTPDLLFVLSLAVTAFSAYHFGTCHGRRRPKERKPPPEACSFCSKSKDEVAKLVAGDDVSMCDECVDLCVEAIEEGAPRG